MTGGGLSFPLRAGGSQRWLQSGRVVGSDAYSSLCVRGGGRGHVLSRAAWVMEGRGERGRQIGSASYRDTLLATLPVPPSLSRASQVLGGDTQRLPSRSPWGAGRQSADWRLQPRPAVQPRRLRAGTHRMWEPQGPGGACHAAEAGRLLCSSLYRSGSWARAETASSVGISGSPRVVTAPQWPSPIAHPPPEGMARGRQGWTTGSLHPLL